MSGRVVAALVAAWMVVSSVSITFMTCREWTAQRHNLSRCSAMGGAYLQAGDKYYGGICIKADGLIWERGQK